MRKIIYAIVRSEQLNGSGVHAYHIIETMEVDIENKTELDNAYAHFYKQQIAWTNVQPMLFFLPTVDIRSLEEKEKEIATPDKKLTFYPIRETGVSSVGVRTTEHKINFRFLNDKEAYDAYVALGKMESMEVE